MKQLVFLPILCILLTGCQMSSKAPEYTETRFLMDTVCTVRAGGTDAKAAVQAALDKIQEIQNCVSFYDENSTVSVFNRADAHQPVSIDVHTEAILKTGLEISRASGGAFDVTIAPVRTLWPFHGEENPAPPEPSAIAERLPLVGYQSLELDLSDHTLTKTKDGVQLDLGGAAKGYAADAALQALKELGAKYGLLDLGGNIALFGKNPERKDGSWVIGLQKPFSNTGDYSQTVTLTDGGAVVTSGTYQRYFTYDGRFYHHILDPATGYPAETESDGVSIVSDSALLADCLSTACLILGEEDGRRLAAQFDAEIYFVNRDDKGGN